MSEKNKDLYKSPVEQIKTTIDKEKHHKKIKELHEKSLKVQEKYNALVKIADLSKQIWETHNVKVAISPKEWDYFLQIDWNNLDIAIKSLNKLDTIISIIEKWVKTKEVNSFKKSTWLWDNTLSLNWDLNFRNISINDSILPTWFDSKLVDSKDKILSKDEVEEIFKFIMNIKWIKKEDWDIESSVCRKNTIIDECKNELWLPSISPKNF